MESDGGCVGGSVPIRMGGEKISLGLGERSLMLGRMVLPKQYSSTKLLALRSGDSYFSLGELWEEMYDCIITATISHRTLSECQHTK